MNCKFLFYIPIIALLCSTTSCEKASVNEDASIRQATKSYETAFNQKDSKSLMTFWAENAKYEDPSSGEVITGKSALENLFDSIFAQKEKSELKIHIESITFPNKDEAIETGTAVMHREGKEPLTTVYKTIYKKIDGKWLITQVNEVDTMTPESQYEHLKELEWLVGEWEDEDQDSKNETNTKWDRYKNFITQNFTVYVEGIFELEGHQIIAWDPIKLQIRSWIFDSDGGFGEGVWKKQDHNWVVETSYTTPDGKKGSSLNIYTPLDKNSYKWESIGRELGGELLPDISPVVAIRKKG